MPTVRVISITPDNVDELGIHCVASRKHAGRRRKVEWFKKHYASGLRILMLHDGKGSIGFIEYAPGESVWRAIEAPGFLVIHCIWVKASGQGHASRLIDSVVVEAGRRRLAGVVALASEGTWCIGPEIFLKNGFSITQRQPPFQLCVRLLVDECEPEPRFSSRELTGDEGSLVLRYSGQCPYVGKCLDELPDEAAAQGVVLELVEIAEAGDARRSPTPYGVVSLALGSKVLADHAISRTRFRNILKKEGLL